MGMKKVYYCDKRKWCFSNLLNMISFTLQAGSYNIVSKAKFRIKHGGKNNDFEIESPPLEIKVS